MSGAEELTQRFKELMTLIDEANDKVRSDTLVDLGNLDETISSLCQDVEKAGPEIAREMQPLMARMISGLDQLAQGLTEYQTRNEGS